MFAIYGNGPADYKARSAADAESMQRIKLAFDA
jgi:hypothetical protein